MLLNSRTSSQDRMYDSTNLQFFSGHIPSRECKMDSSCRITVQTCEKQKDRVRLKKFANYKKTGLVAVPDWGKKLISCNSLVQYLNALYHLSIRL